MQSLLFGIAKRYEKIIDTDLWNAFHDTFVIEEVETVVTDEVPF